MCPRPSNGGLFGIFNLWVVAGALLVALSLFCCSWAAFWLSRPERSAAGRPTAILNIVNASTSTPLQPTSVGQATPSLETGIPPSPLPGVITLGAFVQIVGTGGDGLRLRSEPSLNASVLLLGSEAEVFRVEDGPKEADGFTWWYLVGLFDENRRGWAVSNYLAPVQSR